MSQSSLDKDLMFQKIMPSSRSEENAVQEEKPVAAGNLRSRIFGQTAQGSAPMGGIHVVNLMEEVVIQHLDATIEKFNCCRCDQCRSDIVALTLNELTPKYVVCAPENVQELVEQVPLKDVLASLVHAVITVRSHPRH